MLPVPENSQENDQRVSNQRDYAPALLSLWLMDHAQGARQSPSVSVTGFGELIVDVQGRAKTDWSDPPTLQTVYHPQSIGSGFYE